MAQVTMDSKEYLELVDKVRKLEEVEQAMVENVTATYAPENSYSNYNIRIITTFTDSAKKLVVDKVVAMVKEHEDVLEKLVKDKQHVLDFRSGYISHKWSTGLDPWEVDLMENREFKAAWEHMEEQLKGRQEEE